MESVKLHENDLAVMKQFYQQELDKTMKHLQHIKSVLESLGEKGTRIEISVKGGSSSAVKTAEGTVKRGPGRPRKIDVAGSTSSTATSTAKKPRGKKRGPESVWGTFILDTLKSTDNPMTYNDLVEAAMVRFNLADAKRKATSDAIVNASFRLRKNAKKIDTFSAGQREKHVALKSWFDSPGKIGATYMSKAKAQIVKTKPTAAAKAAKPATAPKASAKKPAVKAATPKVSKVTAKKATAKKVAPKAPKTAAPKPAKVVAKKPVVKATAPKAPKVAAKKPVVAKVAAPKVAKPAVAGSPLKRGRKPNEKLQRLKEVLKEVKSTSGSGFVRKPSEAKAKTTVKKAPVAKKAPAAAKKAVVKKAVAPKAVAPKKAAPAKKAEKKS
jgi:hypothetical protein